MEPLRRYPTANSIHSWWSDSNPPGPTISLHTLAKPLMKLLYHRQAAGYMTELRETPLSPESVSILRAYLEFKYIWPSTRILVLEYLAHRAKSSEADARMIVEGSFLNYLIVTTSDDILRLVCTILEIIAGYTNLDHLVQPPRHWTSIDNAPEPCFVDFTVNRDLVKRLFHHQAKKTLANLRDSPLSQETVEKLAGYLEFDFIWPSTRVFVLKHLAWHAKRSEREASLILDGDGLRSASGLLEMHDADVLSSTCVMLRSIAAYESLRLAVINSRVIPQVVSLFEHANTEVQIVARELVEYLLAALRVDISPSSMLYDHRPTMNSDQLVLLLSVLAGRNRAIGKIVADILEVLLADMDFDGFTQVIKLLRERNLAQSLVENREFGIFVGNGWLHSLLSFLGTA